MCLQDEEEGDDDDDFDEEDESKIDEKDSSGKLTLMSFCCLSNNQICRMDLLRFR